MMSFSKSDRKSYGFTLVELLIALTIASLLTAIALPTLKESLRQNTLSRSASIVKGAFINARSQAIQTGRPFGILIERRRHDIGIDAPSGSPPTLDPSSLDYLNGNYASRMYYMQSQMEYRGDTDTAVAYPVFDPPTGGVPVPRFFFPRSSAGLLYALASSGNASPASRLINVGTRFSVGRTEYVFEVESWRLHNVVADPTNDPLFAQGVPAGSGTLVSFNFRTFSPRNNQNAGTRNVSGLSSTFPAGLSVYQPTEFRFRVNPVRAPLAPVSLLSRTVIDLSISGPSSDPLAFNCQNIIDAVAIEPIPNVPAIPRIAPNTLLGDVLVMFAPDGRLDGIYYDEREITGGVIDRFTPVRIDPSTTVSFNVGYVDGILDNIDDGARYPDAVAGTTYDPRANAPALANPNPPALLAPTKVPNWANSDCAWVSIQPLSGAIRLDTVASQPSAAVLSTYYGLGANPTARRVIRSRVEQSRRLATGGTVR